MKRWSFTIPCTNGNTLDLQGDGKISSTAGSGSASCVGRDKQRCAYPRQYSSGPALCLRSHTARAELAWVPSVRGNENVLNSPDVFWSEEMKHIVTEYGQVMLTAFCVLNFLSWWKCDKVHCKKPVFKPKAQRTSPRCVWQWCTKVCGIRVLRYSYLWWKATLGKRTFDLFSFAEL